MASTKAYLVFGTAPFELGDTVTVHEITMEQVKIPDPRDRAYDCAAARERRRREEAARAQRFAHGYSTMLEADDATRAVLELHRPVEKFPRWGDALVCEGCDFDGYESESPAWPCRTVTTLGAVHGHDMTWFTVEHGGDGPRAEAV